MKLHKQVRVVDKGSETCDAKCLSQNCLATKACTNQNKGVKLKVLNGFATLEFLS